MLQFDCNIPIDIRLAPTGAGARRISYRVAAEPTHIDNCEAIDIESA